MITIRKPVEFQWDKGNIDKNQDKHLVSNKEAEEIFFDKKQVLYKDILHSQKEDRFILIGKTKNGRLLYIVFTMRNKKVRVITARDISKKEIQLYEKKTSTT